MSKNFILPGFAEKFQLNKALIELYENYREYFNEDVYLECFFGNFYLNAWEGGRVFDGSASRIYYEDIITIRDFYNEKGYPLRLTFTNPMIQEEHLTDTFSNLILNLLDNNMNQILVNAPILEEYIRNNYPSYGLVSSTTKCLLNTTTIKQELNNYNYIQHCIDYNLNHNLDFLTSLNQKEKDKVEFLCNAICPPGCPNRKEHYRRNGLSVLNAGAPYRIDCNIQHDTLSLINQRNQLTPEEIDNYEKLGFSHFKLEGRTLSNEEVLHNYLKYLIKPEYQLKASHILFKSLGV